MNLDDAKKISAVMIIEVMGRPPEYLGETLNNIAESMGKEKGVRVIGNKVNPPALIAGQKDFYSSFSEVAVETENLLYLIMLVFKYMPAHIEIISPQNISLPNFEWNDVMNEITGRLHGYDEIAKILSTEKKILEGKLRSLIESQKNNAENSVKKEEKEENGAEKERAKKGKKKK